MPCSFASKWIVPWILGLALPAAASNSQITLTWFDNSNNETSFKIERALEDLPFTQIAIINADVWEYTDDAVSPSTAYRYRIRASNASGDSAYSNAITVNTTLIYSGAIGANLFAAAFDSQYRIGTLYILISRTGEVLIMPLSVSSDGTFSTLGVSSSTNDRARLGGAAEIRTFRGRVFDGSLTGTIEELGLSYSATIRSAAGPTAYLAGVYVGSTIHSASGATYLVVNAQSEAYVFSVNSTSGSAGAGTILPNGTFSIQTPQSIIEGTINPVTKVFQGSIHVPNQPAADFLGTEVNRTRTDRLINLSSRGRLDSNGGAETLIAGFVLGGKNPKRMLLRAVGPSLGRFGVQNALRNPRLQLFDHTGQVIAQNDDWENAILIDSVGDLVGAFKLDRNSMDSSLLATLDPGVYSAQVHSSGGNGVALVEIYDASEDLLDVGLLNLSTRGYIDTNEGAITIGFVVGGNVPKRLLVRGVGPSLESFGVTDALTDPLLRVYQNTATIAQNDDWSTPYSIDASQSAASRAEIGFAATQVGAFQFDSGSRDAAIIVTLAPGSYTAGVSGVDNTTGSALVEIYQIPIDR
jgi:hypothetical protein